MLPTVQFLLTPVLLLHHLVISLVPAIIYIGACIKLMQVCTIRINPSGEPLREGELQYKLCELRAIEGHVENMIRTSVPQDGGERNLRSYRSYDEHQHLVHFMLFLVAAFYTGTCLTLNTNPNHSNTFTPVVMSHHLMISLVPAIIYIGTCIKLMQVCTIRINPSGEPLREGELHLRLWEPRSFWRGVNFKVGLSLKMVGMV